MDPGINFVNYYYYYFFKQGLCLVRGPTIALSVCLSWMRLVSPIMEGKFSLAFPVTHITDFGRKKKR